MDANGIILLVKPLRSAAVLSLSQHVLHGDTGIDYVTWRDAACLRGFEWAFRSHRILRYDIQNVYCIMLQTVWVVVVLLIPLQL